MTTEGETPISKNLPLPKWLAMHPPWKLWSGSAERITHAGYAQAGQIPNNIQIPISNDHPFPSPPRGEGKGEGISNFGHLVIGNYLGFGIWVLESVI
jgi:hypothetical protein